MKSIALVGNPNSGKSTLFNALTGSSQFVGNWPGVTVEKKEGKAKIAGETVRVMDLPGIYSLSPYSNEEIISRDYILNENPDVVIDIIDATNLERNLYLTTQIIELGVPVIVALNMMDVVKQKGEELSAKALSKELGCPVVEISAIKKEGIEELKKVFMDLASGAKKVTASSFKYSEDMENALADIKGLHFGEGAMDKHADFITLKILSDDQVILKSESVASDVTGKAFEYRKALEERYDDDIDTIIAEQRYTWIKSIINSVITKRNFFSSSLCNY